MSSFIGQLRISLGLDSAAFESGAKRAAAEVNTLGSKAEAAGFKIGSMAKALVAGASAFAGLSIVEKLKDAVTASLEYASSLSETAQQLGVTVESLQQFRLLAEQSGVAEETMDKALQKLTRSMGEAEAGGKKQTTAFDALGISLRDATGQMKTADQILPDIAGALEKVTSPAERARYEVALFGKSGQDLEPLLGQGEQAIESFLQKARDAGIIISKDLADKADSAVDTLNILRRTLELRWTVAIAEHAGDIDRIATSLSNVADRFFRLINALKAFANSPAAKWLSWLNGKAQAFTPVGVAAIGFNGLIDASDHAQLRSLRHRAAVRCSCDRAAVARTSPAWGRWQAAGRTALPNIRGCLARHLRQSQRPAPPRARWCLPPCQRTQTARPRWQNIAVVWRGWRGRYPR